MTWLSLILNVLKFVNFLIGEAEKNKWIDEGGRRQIAASLKLMEERVAQSEKIHENVQKLDDESLGDLFDRLGSDGVPNAAGDIRNVTEPAGKRVLSDIQKDSQYPGRG